MEVLLGQQLGLKNGGHHSSHLLGERSRGSEKPENLSQEPPCLQYLPIHVPQKWSSFVGKYSIHGAPGISRQWFFPSDMMTTDGRQTLDKAKNNYSLNFYL